MTKLIYIANARIPTEKAHGLQIVKMCAAFAENGLKVKLIVPRRWNLNKQDPYAYYDVKRVFSIIRVPCLDLIPVLNNKIGYFIQTLTFLFCAKILLLGEKYDFLFTRELLVPFIFKNVVVELHNLPKTLLSFYLKALKHSLGIVTTTRALKNRLLNEGDISKNIFYYPNCVDIKKYEQHHQQTELRKGLNLPLNKKIVLYLGSFYLYDWKGLDIYLKAAELGTKNTLFLAVGGTEREIKNITQKYKAPNLLLVPRVDSEETIKYLFSADILVLPNKQTADPESKYYTSPLKMFEYMASGKPIVATKIPALNEILNNKNAKLVEPSDFKQMHRAINYLLNNPERARELGVRAKKDVKKYSWSNRAMLIIKFMEQSK